MEEVKLALLMVVLFAANAKGIAEFHEPFDVYIHAIKNKHTTVQMAKFNKECGINASGSIPTYGINVGAAWVVSRNLPKSVWQAESDFMTTAEIYEQDGSIRVVNLWTTDVASEQDTMFCLDSSGKVRFLTSTQWSLPYESGRGITFGWAYRQHQSFDTNGKMIGQHGGFLDGIGRNTTKPKLDQSDEKNFRWVPTDKKLTDFRFPSAMLQ